MPLEPLSALAVASSVITFVDFTGKLISAGVELYQNDTLVEHAELKAAAELLLSFRDKAIGPRRVSGIDYQGTDLHNSAVSLESLREAQSNCVQCAEDVIEALEKVTVTGQHRRWQSFRQALSSVLGSKKLDNCATSIRSTPAIYFVPTLTRIVSDHLFFDSQHHEPATNRATTVRSSFKLRTISRNAFCRQLKAPM